MRVFRMLKDLNVFLKPYAWKVNSILFNYFSLCCRSLNILNKMLNLPQQINEIEHFMNIRKKAQFGAPKVSAPKLDLVRTSMLIASKLILKTFNSRVFRISIIATLAARCRSL